MSITAFSLLIAEMAYAQDRTRAGQTPLGWYGVGLIAAVAAVIILAAWLIMKSARARQRRNSNSPWALFKELAAAHALTNRERQLLTRLAHERRPDQPAALFVDAALWDAAQLGPAWTSSVPEVERLRRRLFALR